MIWLIDLLQGERPGLRDANALTLARRQLQNVVTPWLDGLAVEPMLSFHRWLGTECNPLDWRDPSTRLGFAGLEAHFARRFRTISADEDWLEVSTHGEVAILEQVQQALVGRVARSQVTIEINPTSNFVVAGATSVLDRPAFRLHPLVHGEQRDVLDITLNADDPLLFSTSLADEYAYAWAAMASALRANGHHRPHLARHWLETAAENSWRTRFTGSPG